MKKTIYNNAFTRFTDKEFDEKYALISHAIQLGDTINAKKYRDILKENGIDASDLPSAELFNKDNKIEFRNATLSGLHLDNSRESLVRDLLNDSNLKN